MNIIEVVNGKLAGKKMSRPIALKERAADAIAYAVSGPFCLRTGEGNFHGNQNDDGNQLIVVIDGVPSIMTKAEIDEKYVVVKK